MLTSGGPEDVEPVWQTPGTLETGVDRRDRGAEDGAAAPLLENSDYNSDSWPTNVNIGELKSNGGSRLGGGRLLSSVG